MAFTAGDEEDGEAGSLGPPASSTDEEQRRKAPEVSANGLSSKAGDFAGRAPAAGSGPRPGLVPLRPYTVGHPNWLHTGPAPGRALQFPGYTTPLTRAVHRSPLVRRATPARGESPGL